MMDYAMHVKDRVVPRVITHTIKIYVECLKNDDNKS